MPKVSVCIPVYNVEQFIGSCIESLLNQSMQDIEIILVNDCSQDNSLMVIEEYAARDHRIRVICHNENRGAMLARATAYLCATGDYITFCDGDDCLPEYALDYLYLEAESSNADVVSGIIQMVTDVGQLEKRSFSNKLMYGNSREAIYKSLLCGELSHNVCGKLFKRNVLQNNPYKIYSDFSNAEDGLFFYQVVKYITSISLINEVVYYYQYNSNSSTHIQYSDKALRSILFFNKERIEIVSEYPELKEQAVFAVLYDSLRLWADGYNLPGRYQDILVEMGLDKIVTWNNFFKDLPMKYLIINIIRRMRVRCRCLLLR